jgi:hypothetical protein
MAANQREKLRQLRFGGIMQRFLTMRGSSVTHRRLRMFALGVPVMVSFAACISNYIQVSFGVYLKYQALIDGYHDHRISESA